MNEKNGKLYQIENKDWELVKTMISPSGELTPLLIEYFESIEEESLKFFFSLMGSTKFRRNEYALAKYIKKVKGKLYLVLENGLKKSRKVREIAVIEPFYSFITERLDKAKDLITEAREEYFLNKTVITDTFKDVLKPILGIKVCPRSFEKLTVTYLSMNTSKGNKSLSSVTGHKSPKNVEAYIATPELNALNAVKGIEGDLKKLSNQNLMVANDLYNKMEVLESKMDKIISLLES